MDLCQLIVVGVVLCCDGSANGRRRGVTRMRARGFPPTGGGQPSITPCYPQRLRRFGRPAEPSFLVQEREEELRTSPNGDGVKPVKRGQALSTPKTWRHRCQQHHWGALNVRTLACQISVGNNGDLYSGGLMLTSLTFYVSCFTRTVFRSVVSPSTDGKERAVLYVVTICMCSQACLKLHRRPCKVLLRACMLKCNVRGGQQVSSADMRVVVCYM